MSPQDATFFCGGIAYLGLVHAILPNEIGGDFLGIAELDVVAVGQAELPFRQLPLEGGSLDFQGRLRIALGRGNAGSVLGERFEGGFFLSYQPILDVAVVDGDEFVEAQGALEVRRLALAARQQAKAANENGKLGEAAHQR